MFLAPATCPHALHGARIKEHPPWVIARCYMRWTEQEPDSVPGVLFKMARLTASHILLVRACLQDFIQLPESEDSMTSLLEDLGPPHGASPSGGLCRVGGGTWDIGSK